MSAAGQIFASAKSAFTPSLALDCCRQAPMGSRWSSIDTSHTFYLRRSFDQKVVNAYSFAALLLLDSLGSCSNGR
ncbi:MAG: hypothetical protein CVV06_08455 [Gammaproteobacteria bacterium HGW-Gammaproteobacteria-10]|nr:MAG: hypothetical protein CVV06_08455 [Gammaproteobacteria bacterium HGW-Gammaproteobacteria-10]